MGMSAVSNQFFLETRFITLYNDAFRNWEFNIEVICKDPTLLFLRPELDCYRMEIPNIGNPMCVQKYRNISKKN